MRTELLSCSKRIRGADGVIRNFPKAESVQRFTAMLYTKESKQTWLHYTAHYTQQLICSPYSLATYSISSVSSVQEHQ